MCSRLAILLACAAIITVQSDSSCASDNPDHESLLQSQVHEHGDSTASEEAPDPPKTAAVPGAKSDEAVKKGKSGDKPDSKEKAKPAPAPAGISGLAAFAEYVAMTLFVIIGCGSAMSVAKEDGWVLQVSLTFGLAITSLAYAVGHYSGGQINCAVTLGLVVAGKLSVGQAGANFVAQMLGSITGALFLRGIFPEEKDKTGGLATNAVSEGWSPVNALVGEIAMTFLLMYVVLETAVNPASKANRELACVAIGFAVFLAHSVLITIDGCSINPTRTFGPALVRALRYKNSEGAFSDHWVFWAGPLIGASLAAVVSTSMMK